MMGQRKLLIGIIGDTDGSVKKALEELAARDSSPNVGIVSVTPSMLGMGTGEPLPEEPEPEPDFLQGIPPWAGRPSIQ